MFTTVLMTASQIALRNHKEVKLDALRAAVLNAALDSKMEDELQLMFLNLVDSFTVYHLKILMLMHYLRIIMQKLE